MSTSVIISGREVTCFSQEEISDAVCQLFIDANHDLPECVKKAVDIAFENEPQLLSKQVLKTIRENTDCAIHMNIPICQDTGMAVTFVDIGRDVFLDCDLEKAVNLGVSKAYSEGYLRKSIVSDPLYNRINTEDNTPALIHYKFSGEEMLRKKIRITAAPKGFGSENMSKLKMFTPSATEDDIVEFVVDAVKSAGSNPCPPIFVGVGIGSDFEGSALLAKKALLREEQSHKAEYAALEGRLLERINKLNIGPQGFGGNTTALGVYVESAPTHIAGLPVAVNINCHVARHKTIIIS